MAKAVKEGTRTTARGNVLTDRDVEAIADEAERGYDLTKGEILYVHRGGALAQLSFRVPDDLLDATRRFAAREGRSVSDVCREAMARYMTAKLFG